MKLKKLIILIGLLILMISSVSANENITETNITSVDFDEISSDNNVKVINESEKSYEITDNINITFDKQMWVENLTEIEVKLPENASGNFCLKIDNLEIYNQSITSKTFNIPIKLPEPRFPYIIENIYPPRDFTNYKVTAFYNNIELNLTQKMLTVMKFSPDYEYRWTIPKEILQYDSNIWNALIFPRSANGIGEIYIDDKLINKTTINEPYFYYKSSEITDLPLGNHSMKINYYNDSYYHNAAKIMLFEVVDVKIDIPQTIYIGHDDCISVKVLKNTSGTINIYINNELICSDKVNKNGEFLISLEKYLKNNSNEVKVEFKSKNLFRQKITSINITYDFGYVGYSTFIYGKENIIELILPDYINNSLVSVKINGTYYSFTHPKYYENNIVEIDISNLNAGNYIIELSYLGDLRFNEKTEKHEFKVVYSPIFPYYIEYGDNSSVSLTLPENAAGNLTVYINEKVYKTMKLSNGKSSIVISDLTPDEYILTAKYDGNDYNVMNESTHIYVNPKISIDYYFTAGQNKFITIEVPKYCKGHVIFYIDDNEYTAIIKDGVVKFSLKDLKAGTHLVYIEYYGENGFETSDENIITVYKPKLRIISSKIYTNSIYVKIKATDNNGKIIKNAQISFKINGKVFKAKTNSNGIATIKASAKLQAKKYIVTATYNGCKISKKISAKHVLSLKKVAVKKSSKRLVLKATLKQGNKIIKSKTVTFKFNEKTYKSKTNSKGIAKVTIKSNTLKKLKVNKTVKYQAMYLNDVVKKVCKVKK